MRVLDRRSVPPPATLVIQASGLGLSNVRLQILVNTHRFLLQIFFSPVGCEPPQVKELINVLKPYIHGGF